MLPLYLTPFLLLSACGGPSIPVTGAFTAQATKPPAADADPGAAKSFETMQRLAADARLTILKQDSRFKLRFSFVDYEGSWRLEDQILTLSFETAAGKPIETQDGISIKDWVFRAEPDGSILTRVQPAESGKANITFLKVTK
jgi:hypothetical protein